MSQDFCPHELQALIEQLRQSDPCSWCDDEGASRQCRGSSYGYGQAWAPTSTATLAEQLQGIRLAALDLSCMCGVFREQDVALLAQCGIEQLSVCFAHPHSRLQHVPPGAQVNYIKLHARWAGEGYDCGFSPDEWDESTWADSVSLQLL